jgi:hypothetical protein
MKRFLIVVCLAGAIQGWNAAAADAFPWWFHTRPKPVLLDDRPPPPPAAARNRAPDSRRPKNNFDSRQERQAQPSKSRLSEFLTRGWRQRSK